jgi:hypothetical protein
MRAFFEPYQVRTDMVPGETDFEKGGLPRAFDCNHNTPTYLFVRGDEKQPRKSKPLAPGLPRFLSFTKFDITPVPLPPEAHTPGLRALVLENHLRAAERQIAAARQALGQAKAGLAVTVAEKALAAALLQPEALKARAAADRARVSGTPPAPPPERRGGSKSAPAPPPLAGEGAGGRG